MEKWKNILSFPYITLWNFFIVWHAMGLLGRVDFDFWPFIILSGIYRTFNKAINQLQAFIGRDATVIFFR
jgi:hypothetical protein